MSDQNLVWSDIMANEIIRTRLNVRQLLNWSDILSDHLIIPTGVGSVYVDSASGVKVLCACIVPLSPQAAAFLNCLGILPSPYYRASGIGK